MRVTAGSFPQPAKLTLFRKNVPETSTQFTRLARASMRHSLSSIVLPHLRIPRPKKHAPLLAASTSNDTSRPPASPTVINIAGNPASQPILVHRQVGKFPPGSYRAQSRKSVCTVGLHSMVEQRISPFSLRLVQRRSGTELPQVEYRNQLSVTSTRELRVNGRTLEVAFCQHKRLPPWLYHAIPRIAQDHSVLVQQYSPHLSQSGRKLEIWHAAPGNRSTQQAVRAKQEIWQFAVEHVRDLRSGLRNAIPACQHGRSKPMPRHDCSTGRPIGRL